MLLVMLPPAGTQASCDGHLHWVGGIGGGPFVSSYDVAVWGTTAYLRDYYYGLNIYDISNPASPVSLGYIGLHGKGYSVTVSGTHVYAASGSSATAGYFEVVDVSNPVSPVLQASIAIPGWGIDVVVSGNFAYVVEGSGALRVIDVSNPALPVIVGNLAITGASKIALSGSVAYFANGPNGITVVDVSIPTNPVILRSMVIPGWSANLAVSGTRLYVTNPYGDPNGPPGLQVLDVSNPSFPTILGSLVTTNAGSIAVSGTTAYTAVGFGLKAIDVSNPTSPAIIDSIGLPSSAGGLVLSGTIISVAAGSAGLQLIEHCINAPPALQNPGTQSGTELTFFSVTVTASDANADSLTMSLVGPSPTWATFSDVGNGNALFRGTPQAGQAGTYPVSIRVSDGVAADTTSFNIVIGPAMATVNLDNSGFVPGTVAIHTGTQVKWVKVAGGNHTTTNGTGPLDPAAGTLWDAQLRASSPQFIRVFPTGGTFPYFCRNHPSETGTITVNAQTGIDERPSPHLRLTASPNPFRGNVDLEFDLERPEHVSVVIVDLAGRKVRELVTGEFPAGTHRITWEGRDERLQAVRTGLYFARLYTGDGQVEARKLFKIR